MKAKKVIISILIVVISVLLGSTNVLAHPTKATVSGCEDVGWLEMENRHNKNTIIGYKFDSSATSEVKDATRAGAAMWNGTVTIAEKNITYIGTVHSDYLSYADWTAGVYDIQTDSSGHYTSWKIMVNTRYSIEEETLAHEFGHAIGLYDLYEAKNKDKIMYGYRVGRTATRPTTLDKWGAKVITGAHSSHTWKYKYHSFNSFGNIHVRYCSSCQGLYNSSPNPAPCTYNSSNVCTLCGIPKGVQPSSVVVPASAKLLKIY